MAKDVVDQAVTGCSYGTTPSVLLVGDNHHEIIDNKNVANISDHIPIQNIVPFGLCKSMANPAVAAAQGTPQPCIPITPLKWQQGNKTIIMDNEKFLDDQCVCSCIWKGIIAITDAGQNSCFADNDAPKSKKKKLRNRPLKQWKVSKLRTKAKR